MRKALEVFLVVTGVWLIPSNGGATTIDFESLLDGETVTTQFPGLSFSNVITLTAGVSLNESEFPPLSGSNVASDLGGPIEIDFTVPVSNVEGYFTYAAPLLLQAFNASHALLGSVSSAFSINTALSGDPGSSPNELLGLALGNISFLTITGDQLGGSFTLDDFSFTAGESTPVPEPATLALMGAGLFAISRRRRRRSHRGN
jgi:hypothetical protein